MYKFLGVSEDNQKCQKCGKEDLKRTIALLIEETNTVVYFGTHCAAAALGNGLTGRDIANQAAAIEKAQALIAAGHNLSEIAHAINIQNDQVTRATQKALFIGDFAAINQNGELFNPADGCVFLTGALLECAHLIDNGAAHYAKLQEIAAELKAQYGFNASVTGTSIRVNGQKYNYRGEKITAKLF
jgi:hypothetical protein